VDEKCLPQQFLRSKFYEATKTCSSCVEFFKQKKMAQTMGFGWHIPGL